MHIKPDYRKQHIAGVLLSLLLCLQIPLANASERWQRLEGFLQQSTGAGGYPGAVAVVEHQGNTVFQGQWGHSDLSGHHVMREDSIFRIYSMTKPIASVALLMLLEEGKLSLDDPLAKHLPEFANLQVAVGGTVQVPQLEAPSQPVTLRHLLTHTSGFAADSSSHPVATGMLSATDLDNASSLVDVAQRLSRTALADNPGTHFHYEGANTDLIGRVVEVVSGQPFAQFLQQRIFDPLGMADTGFDVPTAKRARVVDLPTSTADGQLVRADTASARTPGARLKAYDNGAGGLYSTADDYLKFARMLLNDGRVGKAQLLSRKTIDLMMADQLGAGFGAPIDGFSRGEGFGLGGYVVTDSAVRGRLGSVGQFGWSGAASTYFTVDRKEQLVAILMLQYLPDGPKRLPSLATPFYNLVYQAIP
jgi:CubicO group peptidase (beta-lactamase class C family)